MVKTINYHTELKGLREAIFYFLLAVCLINQLISDSNKSESQKAKKNTILSKSPWHTKVHQPQEAGMEHHDDCRKTQQRSPRLHYPSLVLYLILNLFAATMEPIVAASMLIWIIITRHMNYALVFPTKPSFSSILPFTTHF